MTGTVTILVGVALQDREEQFTTLLALSILLPAFLQEGGGLGGILYSRLSSKVHLGLIEPRGVPQFVEIGRASCRARVQISVVAVSLKTTRSSRSQPTIPRS